jgi:hypothetical protein
MYIYLGQLPNNNYLGQLIILRKIKHHIHLSRTINN